MIFVSDVLFKILGKVSAYGIPVIQKVLQMKKEASPTKQSITSLILVHSKEISQQVKSAFDDLTQEFSADVISIDLVSMTNWNIVKCIQSKQPDIIIPTPSKTLNKVYSGLINLGGLKTVAIDNAEQLYLLDFENDLNELLHCIPTKYQSILQIHLTRKQILN